MSSNLEDLFLAQLHLLAPDAPEPQCQVELIEGRKFRCDFYWPRVYIIVDQPYMGYHSRWIEPHGVVVEIDGLAKQAGGGRHMTPADYEKINLLNLQGYCVLRFLGSQLRKDPYTCISMVCQALGVQMRDLTT